MPQTVTIETADSRNEMPLSALHDGLIAFITREGRNLGLVGEAVIKANGSAAILRRGTNTHGGFIHQDAAEGYFVRPLRQGETVTFSSSD